MKYHFYQDNGHGWLRVKRNELRELGISLDISRYSYQSESGKWAYLEEDCDFLKFIIAKGWEPKWDSFEKHLVCHRSAYSKIRHNPRYMPFGG